MAEQTNTSTPVVILGAGATKACGGPLTKDILPLVFQKSADFGQPENLACLDAFLIENFHLPERIEDRLDGDYPPLPLLLSLIDLGRSKKEPFRPCLGGNLWNPETSLADQNSLAEARHELEYGISALLESMLRKVKNYHGDLLSKVFPNTHPAVISFNYDLIIDKTLTLRQKSGFKKARTQGIYPDYGCDVRTAKYQEQMQHGSSGLLLKLHGSLNWLYCPVCNRLDVHVSDEGELLKVAHLCTWVKAAEIDREPGFFCPDCQALMQAVLITPTYFKDYGNPHLTKIWYEAEKLLRRASHVYFIGYSLPDDDVHITYLLKRGLAHLAANDITVVEKDDGDNEDNPIRSRYRILFGHDINWRYEGMEEWLTSL